MRTTDRHSSWLPMVGLALIAGCASTAPRQAEFSRDVSAKATVRGVDPATRELTLELGDGSTAAVVAGPEVRNFDQIAVGDTVEAAYVETMIATRLEADEADAEPAFGAAAGRAEEGQKPGFGLAAGAEWTVVIQSVDTANDLVVFIGPMGVLQTVRVQSDKGREFLAGLKPGDRVKLAYDEAVAVTVK